MIMSSQYPTLSVYERTKVIGVRAEQLIRGAPPLVPIAGGPDAYFDPFSVAASELESGKLPFLVSRTMPDGKRNLVRLVASSTDIGPRGE